MKYKYKSYSLPLLLAREMYSASDSVLGSLGLGGTVKCKAKITEQ
jgi:hypothetical protein